MIIETTKNISKKISFIISHLIDLLFPRRCPACDEIVTPFGQKIHAKCIRKLPLQKPPWCIKCGKHLLLAPAPNPSSDHPQSPPSAYLCHDCQKKNHKFLRGRSLYNYKEIAPSIYRFKYKKRREYADYYAEEIYRYLGDFIKSIKPDALIPVPLHRRRLIKRGYNQAAVLAKEISKLTNIPTYENYIIRKRNTKPLKLLNPSDRQKNLQKAFIVPRNDVKLKTTIIIDDIYTTGATMDEISDVLHEAGVEDVYFVTLASGQGV